MSKEESKQIDAILAYALFARNKGIDLDVILNAFAYDVSMIRHGVNPKYTATEQLLD